MSSLVSTDVDLKDIAGVVSYGYDFISKCPQKSVECNVLWYCMYVPRYNSVTLSILQRPRQQNEIEMSNLVQIEVDDTTCWIRRKKTNPLFTPNAIMSITHHSKARGFNNVAAVAGAVRMCAILSH